MHNDREHWQNLSPPLAPNKFEIEVYEDMLIGYQQVTLLGMTKELIPLVSLAIDLNPIETIGVCTAKRDWNNLGAFQTDAIIGDGVINLIGIELVPKIMRHCDIFISRVFLRPFPGMKYATHFPNRFPKAQAIIRTQPGVIIAIWNRQ